ncbi:MAG: DUF308 domain-containing protein [Kurthia sp.]|nr:DUF308 domain-containing protein [Candidatus Kurthia equi]
MKKPSTITLLTGILFIGIGLFFLINPVAALKIMILIAASLAVIKGLLDLFQFFRIKKKQHKNDYSLLISGVFILILGILLFFNTTLGALFTGIIFAIWFAIESITTLFSLRFFKEKKGAPFFILLILGILTLVMSILMFMLPFTAALSFTLITGIYLVAQGISITLISIKFKSWFSDKKITKEMRQEFKEQAAKKEAANGFTAHPKDNLDFYSDVDRSSKKENPPKE